MVHPWLKKTAFRKMHLFKFESDVKNSRCIQDDRGYARSKQSKLYSSDIATGPKIIWRKLIGN